MLQEATLFKNGIGSSSPDWVRHLEEGEKGNLQAMRRHQCHSLAKWRSVILSRERITPNPKERHVGSMNDVERTMEMCHAILEKKCGSNCMRGLEKWTTLGTETTVMNTNDAYDAVLDEQVVQHDEGKYCDERIAEKYREVSQRSQKKALRLATQDEIEARKYYLVKGCSRLDTSPCLRASRTRGEIGRTRLEHTTTWPLKEELANSTRPLTPPKLPSKQCINQVLRNWLDT
jgi:hypothetical protein